MKKMVLVTLGGMILGMMLMMGMFTILNMQPVKESIFAQDKKEDTEEVVYQTEIIIEETTEQDHVVDNIEEIETEENSTEDETSSQVVEDTMETETEEDTITSEAEDNKPLPLSDTPTAGNGCPYYIAVNRQSNCVTVYTLDTEGYYTVPIKAMTCSVGTDNRTPLGISKISDKYVWRLLFGNSYGQYSVRFNGHILFHSVPYTSPNNYSLKEGQFNLLGEPASQGCIRLCVEDAKWIYDNCARGTIVEVYDSEYPGPLGKPSMPKVDEDSPFKGWDPTDPHPDNPWMHLN